MSDERFHILPNLVDSLAYKNDEALKVIAGETGRLLEGSTCWTRLWTRGIDELVPLCEVDICRLFTMSSPLMSSNRFIAAI